MGRTIADEQPGPSPRRSPARDGSADQNGLDGLVTTTSRLTSAARAEGRSHSAVVLQLGEDFAYIRLADIWRPLRFLRQMAGAPPVQLGTEGFRRELVDDSNPARHYMAFFVAGYWLPRWAAVALLWAWELAGFVRYRGHWSWPDIASGEVGVAHGRLARRYGVTVLPALMACDLGDGPKRPSSG